MDHLPSENDLLLEWNERKGIYSLHRLGKKSSDIASTAKGCVLIPYAHPALEGVIPEFYPIVSTEQIVLKEMKSYEDKIRLIPSLSRSEYIQKVNELKKHIQLGDIYEINFCLEFSAEEVKIDIFRIFLKLKEVSKAPYTYLLKKGAEYILCASPELFLKKQGNVLSTKPIKGTAPRAKDSDEDERLKSELFHSVKERTENVMAVDVARNDLSMIAKRGTVEVNKLYNIESYETVHQLVSTVKCEIRSEAGLNEIIEATFPMASMTGAPKRSAMDLIAQFENFDRKYYSGTMGMTEANGDFELCVIIRSVFYNEKSRRVSFAVGSAITHLCDPEKEYEECMLKANSMLKALNAELRNQ